MDPDRIQLLEELAFRYGRYYDSYLITEPNREYLWSSEDSGVLGYSRRGRYLNVAGGLICSEYHRAEFLADVVEFARLNHLVISFFSIDETDANLFREMGFQVSRFGVESRIDLDGHEWRGKPYEWVRRQVNFVTRQSVIFEEWDSESLVDSIDNSRFDELTEISDEHIAGKPQKGEIPFFEGRLLAGHLHRRRVFVARAENGNGRVEGFAICNPMLEGDRWAIEMYRQREDAPRGTIPFLIKQVLDQFRMEGCEQVSICPVPTIGTERTLPGSSLPARIGMYLWSKWGAAIYDCKGLYHFKSRFRPTFTDVYICAYPGSNWGAVWAYLMTIGTFDVNWGAVWKRLFTFSRQRRTLADPKIEISPVSSPVAVRVDERDVDVFPKQTGSLTSADTGQPVLSKRAS